MTIEIFTTLLIIVVVGFVACEGVLINRRTEADKEVLLECVKHQTLSECEIEQGEVP